MYSIFSEKTNIKLLQKYILLEKLHCCHISCPFEWNLTASGHVTGTQIKRRLCVFRVLAVIGLVEMMRRDGRMGWNWIDREKEEPIADSRQVQLLKYHRRLGGETATRYSFTCNWSQDPAASIWAGTVAARWKFLNISQQKKILSLNFEEFKYVIRSRSRRGGGRGGKNMLLSE